MELLLIHKCTDLEDDGISGFTYDAVALEFYNGWVSVAGRVLYHLGNGVVLGTYPNIDHIGSGSIHQLLSVRHIEMEHSCSGVYDEHTAACHQCTVAFDDSWQPTIQWGSRDRLLGYGDCLRGVFDALYLETDYCDSVLVYRGSFSEFLKEYDGGSLESLFGLDDLEEWACVDPDAYNTVKDKLRFGKWSTFAKDYCVEFHRKGSDAAVVVVDTESGIALYIPAMYSTNDTDED